MTRKFNSKKTHKKSSAGKFILNLFGISIIALYAVVGIIYGICEIGDRIHDGKVKTDYGDSFEWFYNGFLAKTTFSDVNSSFYIILEGEKLKKSDIVSICNKQDFTCYLVGKKTVIYKNTNMDGFKVLLAENLYSDYTLSSNIKSVLLQNSKVFEMFCSFFMDKYPRETEQMLKDIIDEKYDNLSEYGITKDSKELLKIQSIALNIT